MSVQLLHIYGPFSIHIFGTIIAVGLILFSWLIKRDPLRTNIINEDTLNNTIALGIIAGIVGGRLLYVLIAWDEIDSWWHIPAVWEGGLSILGTVVAILAIVPWYLKHNKVPILALLDLAAIYAPLLQSISRIGCFFAGCCFGQATTLPWAIVYMSPDSIAPCHIGLHPTQLYSSALLLGIFVFMYCIARNRYKKQGQLLALYLMLISTERFLVDFLRADRIFLSRDTTGLLSVYQYMALALGIVACGAFVYSSYYSKRLSHSS